MDEELKRRIEEYMQSYKQWDNAMAIQSPSYSTTRNVATQAQHTVYSLAEVQLTGGRMVALTITASPSLGSHLTKNMKETGYLHLFNDSEALMIRAEDVVAVKLTKITTG